MARPLRIEYEHALYHVMARGDGGRMIFETKEDSLSFLKLLSQTCKRCGWRVHAWVLMGNHFHLLLETPKPNLVTGMKWLMGVFSQGWNSRRQRRGHVFQGRYKAVPVNGEQSEGTYLQVVADYIHLNPVRAGLVGSDTGKALLSYPWSSLEHYQSGRGPEWLEMNRVLSAFELAGDRRGRRAYVKSLEVRARDREGLKTEASESALHRGWYLGDEGFRDRLLRRAEAAIRKVRKANVSGEGVKAYGEKEAGRMLVLGLEFLGLPVKRSELGELKPGHEGKAMMARWLRENTAVGNRWIAQKLEMGHDRGVARITGRVLRTGKQRKAYEELNKMLQNAD